MRFSSFSRKLLLVVVWMLLGGCAGLDGAENSAFAKSNRKSQALAALERPKLGPKDLFTNRLPRRQIATLAVAGDSLSIGLASELEKTLASRPQLGFAKLGKVSSGLARPDFFDWDRHMEDLARRYRPDAVVVMLGANDNKPLRMQDGSQIPYATHEWNKAYMARIQRIVDIVRTHNPTATVFWMGAPIMADPDLSRDLRHINALARKVMASGRDCHYVDTWALFADSGGGFAFSKPDVEAGAILRARDGVHLTTAGAQALAVHCLDALESRIDLETSAPGGTPVAATGF
ncbi:MAG: DUF459 domain-containing protein [Acidobacteriota bacterium]